MLLALRSLWESSTATTTVVKGGKQLKGKLARKLQRLARWSEAIAPPLIDVVAPVQGIALEISIAPVRVSVAALTVKISGDLGIKAPGVSVAAPVKNISGAISVGNVTVKAGIDLFDYEIAALMAA